MPRIFTSATFALLAACVSAPDNHGAASWQPAIDPQAVQVMVVGTYHMAGSSGDLINVETDSVLTERRQRELDNIALALKSFNPTVVVTERVTDAPDYVDVKYAKYTDAMLLESENERVQVAYRLANRSGVKRVYGLDERQSEGEPDYFPFGRLMAHAAATGQKDELDTQIASAQKMVEEFTTESKDVHIAEKLLRMNLGAVSGADFYYALAKFDQGEEQPAAELQAYWFMRNAKIWSKLLDVTEPGDRVVVVYGAGHKF